MVESEKNIDKQNIMNVDQILDKKLNYLQQIKKALNSHNDLLIYQLIHDPKYYRFVDKEKNTNINFISTIDDIYDYISHYLSIKLIDYLGKTYPFFYYDEYKLGKFNIYFGKWWSHKLFGSLDVLNIKFYFNKEEYNKLQQTFDFSGQDKTFNTQSIQKVTSKIQELQKLIDSQETRDKEKVKLRSELHDNASKSKLPWDTGKVKEQKNQIINRLSKISEQDDAALNANQAIKEHENKILSLSKEDTILEYEKDSIQDHFKNFNDFNENNHKLYDSYIKKLSNEKQVNDYNG